MNERLHDFGNHRPDENDERFTIPKGAMPKGILHDQKTPINAAEEVKTAEQSAAPTTIDTTEAVNKNKSEERIQAPLNPEDERLPGNAQWFGRLSTAWIVRWKQFRAWDQTHFDRFHSRGSARTESGMEGRIAILTRQNMEHARRSGYHAAQKQRIENSRWNSFAIGRMISQAGIQYHAWQEQRADRKEKRFDAKIDRANGRLERAKREKTYYDERIGKKIHSIEEALSKRLAPIEEHRQKIDARMEELGNAIGHHETIIASIRGDVEKVEAALQERPHQKERKNLAGVLKKLNMKLTLQEQSLKDAGKLFERCDNHRRRLANAHAECETARDAISDRYTNHVERKIAPETKALPTRESLERTLEEILADISIEAGEKRLPLSSFVAIWKLTFPAASFKNQTDFIDMFGEQIEKMPESRGILAAVKDPNVTFAVPEYIKLIENLFQTSGLFREYVQRAGGRKGEKGLSYTISRLKESIARRNTENL